MAEPQQIESYPAQTTRGSRLEGYRYTSKEFFDKEWEGMWTKVWLLLGREAELPNPGDWQMEPVGREEILMVRQTDGSVKAFYNVCQHRGNPLVEGEKGSVRRFVCKYHSWAFMPDGELNFAPDQEDFAEGNPCVRKLGAEWSVRQKQGCAQGRLLLIWPTNLKGQAGLQGRPFRDRRRPADLWWAIPERGRVLIFSLAFGGVRTWSCAGTAASSTVFGFENMSRPNDST